MKVFIYGHLIIKEERLAHFNKGLKIKGRETISPLIQEVPDDCVIKDFENGIFSQTLYNARKQAEKEKRYESLVERYIRHKYSLNAELAILRQRNTKPEEFLAYHAYAEECKAKAKADISEN